MFFLFTKVALKVLETSGLCQQLKEIINEGKVVTVRSAVHFDIYEQHPKLWPSVGGARKVEL